jgi:hypothetical protein
MSAPRFFVFHATPSLIVAFALLAGYVSLFWRIEILHRELAESQRIAGVNSGTLSQCKDGADKLRWLREDCIGHYAVAKSKLAALEDRCGVGQW